MDHSSNSISHPMFLTDIMLYIIYIFIHKLLHESLLPADKRTKFLNSESLDIEKVIDYYVCSQSDVFVPATSGLFYTSVAGMRIASGRTQTLVPSQVMTSNFASDYLSPYISEKNHPAYSCYC